MDMNEMDMGGMEMASEGPFRAVNEAIARGLWYGIAACVAVLTLTRIARLAENRQRRVLQQQISGCISSRPRGAMSQALATATATSRELSYPQPIYFNGRISRYFTPLPVGRWIILLIYWTAILCFVWSDTILRPDNPMYAYKWEKVGFRAAWVSVAQIPFIYLLSCKFNPISTLTGISYERFNWLHRWAARTVFLTIIVHWSFFFREWWLADFVTLEIKMMPMVKYGFGAWAVIGWMVLSGFGFFRNQSYEIFVAQHICAAATLLWLLFMHVPAYARYYIYLAIAFVAFDWTASIVWAIMRNAHLGQRSRRRPVGYSVCLSPLVGERVRLTIDDAAFDWKAGQHVYLSIPRLRPLELHPFTIANASVSDKDCKRRLTMVIKAHAGFSKRLYKAAVSSTNSGRRYRAFLSGPWGHPPDLRSYETVVLIACSSGASFTIPLLQELLRQQSCVRNITFHWIIRSADHFRWFENELVPLMEKVGQRDLRLQVIVHITEGPGPRPQASNTVHDSATFVDAQLVELTCENGSSFGSVASFGDEKTPLSLIRSSKSQQHASTLSMRYAGRPTVESMIRPPVEFALGETAVVTCGGLSITAQSRTFVAALSDERAVHKGSGAQGIFLFTESYGW